MPSVDADGNPMFDADGNPSPTSRPPGTTSTSTTASTTSSCAGAATARQRGDHGVHASTRSPAGSSRAAVDLAEPRHQGQPAAYTEIQDLSYTYDASATRDYRNDVPADRRRTCSAARPCSVHLRPVRAASSSPPVTAKAAEQAAHATSFDLDLRRRRQRRRQKTQKDRPQRRHAR